MVNKGKFRIIARDKNGEFVFSTSRTKTKAQALATARKIRKAPHIKSARVINVKTRRKVR